MLVNKQGFIAVFTISTFLSINSSTSASPAPVLLLPSYGLYHRLLQVGLVVCLFLLVIITSYRPFHVIIGIGLFQYTCEDACLLPCCNHPLPSRPVQGSASQRSSVTEDATQCVAKSADIEGNEANKDTVNDAIIDRSTLMCVRRERRWAGESHMSQSPENVFALYPSMLQWSVQF